MAEGVLYIGYETLNQLDKIFKADADQDAAETGRAGDLAEKGGRAMNDGGPAFPAKVPSGNIGYKGETLYLQVSGMTLRDWFAGMAMQGLASGLEWTNGRVFGSEELAEDAFSIADSMLAERKKHAYKD
jgi:hypothetical protein